MRGDSDVHIFTRFIHTSTTTRSHSFYEKTTRTPHVHLALITVVVTHYSLTAILMFVCNFELLLFIELHVEYMDRNFQIRNAATVHHVSHAVKLIGENPTKRRPGHNAAVGHSRSISKFVCKGFKRKNYVVYTDIHSIRLLVIHCISYGAMLVSVAHRWVVYVVLIGLSGF